MSRHFLAFLLVALALDAAALSAQTTPAVFHACYVPASGTVYRIGEPGLREDCVSHRHVRFSWTDGEAAVGALSGYVHVRTDGAVASESSLAAIAACPDGKVAVGGGYSVGDTDPHNVYAVDNEPWPRVDFPNQWRVNAQHRTGGTGWKLYVNVVCVNAP